MACIYLAKNKINGKAYIGKTIHSLDYRREGHLRDAQTGSKTIFHRALAKYGPESFEWAVLCDGLEDDESSDYEIFFIRKHNTKTPNGYNMTDGGDGLSVGFKMSEETRKRMSLMRKGKKLKKGYRHTEEARRKISAPKEGKTYLELYGEERTAQIKEVQRRKAMGRGHTEETKKKIREKRAKQIISKETRKKMSESQTRRHKVNPHTEEAKLKMSLSQKGRKFTEEHKKNISVATRAALKKKREK